MGYYDDGQTGFTDNAKPKRERKKIVKRVRKVRKNSPLNVTINRVSWSGGKTNKYTAVTKINGAVVTVTHKTKHVCESETTNLLSAFGYVPEWVEGTTKKNSY